jgi:hypothetical protein
LRVISSKYTRLSRLCVCELCLNRHESTRCSRDRSRSSPSQMRICFSSGVIFLGNHISNSPSVDLRLLCVLRGHERRPGDTVFWAVSHCWRKIAVIFQHKPTRIARGGRRHLAVFRVVPTERAKFAIEADRLHAHPLVRSCASHLAPKELESLPVSRVAGAISPRCYCPTGHRRWRCWDHHRHRRTSTGRNTQAQDRQAHVCSRP